MKYLYSPDCSGTVWSGLSENSCLSGYKVVSTMGLVTHLEFLSGIHYPDAEEIDRIMAYREAMRASHDLGPFEESFAVNEMMTAKECLALRDGAVMLGWNRTAGGQHPRLDALASFERNFRTDIFPSLGERAAMLAGLGVDISDNGEDSVVVAAASRDCMPSVIDALLGSLKGCRVVSIEEEFSDALSSRDNDISRFADSIMNGVPFVPAGDGSLEVIQYHDEVEMLDDIIARDRDFDVWINRDNVMLDAWSRLTRRPAPGAGSSAVSPALQTFTASVNLFLHPSDPENLLRFLQAAECPVKDLKAHSRELLRNGGLEDLHTCEFIPSPQDFLLESGDVRKSSLEDFFSGFKAHVARLIKGDDRKADGQSVKLFSLLKVFLTLIKDEQGDSIPPSRIEALAFCCDPVRSKDVSIAQTGSIFVVPAADSLLAPADRTIWVDADLGPVALRVSSLFSEQELSSFETSGSRFALPSSRIREMESTLHRQLLALPVRLTMRKLVLCVSRNVEKTEDPVNPLVIRVLNYRHFDKMEDPRTPDPDKEYNPLVTVFHREGVARDRVTSLMPSVSYVQDASGIVNVKVPEGGISWRNVESPSSLAMLIQDPLDYVFRYILKFENEDSYRLPSIGLAKGNVAHLTIQDLLCRRHLSSGEEIRRHLDESFSAALTAKGLVLLKPEHDLELHRFRRSVREYAVMLLRIIQGNGYEVEDVEVKTDDDGLLLGKGVHVSGYIDMLLRRKDDGNRKFVLDFKYTSHFDEYVSRIEEGRDIQLALYRDTLERKEHFSVDGTAYFLMSDKTAALYTPDDALKGDHVRKCPALDYASVADEIRNSYWERRNMINEGKIELGQEVLSAEVEGMEVNLLDYYGKIAGGQELLPLKVKHVRGGNDRKAVSMNFTNLKQGSK